MTEHDTSGKPAWSGGRCPICQAPAVYRYRPFCSRRCAHVDLAKWLNEDYAIPVDGDAAATGVPVPANDSHPGAEMDD